MRTDTKPISLRLTIADQRYIDGWLEAQSEKRGIATNRSAFMAAAATAVAKSLLATGTVPLLPRRKTSGSSRPVTMSVTFAEAQERVIRKACAALNQRFSPFVLWATLVFISKHPIKTT